MNDLSFLLHLHISFFIILSLTYFSGRIAQNIFKFKSKLILLPSIGLIILTFWNGIFFKILPLYFGWLFLGFYLLLFHFSSVKSVFASFKKDLLLHLKGSFLLLLFFNIFLAHLYYGNKFGPWSEGGGDSSIYIGCARQLVRDNMPAFGLRDAIFDTRKLFHLSSPPGNVTPNYAGERDLKRSNPPAIDAQAYRVNFRKISDPFSHTLIGMWAYFYPNYISNFYVLLGLIYIFSILVTFYAIRVFSLPAAILCSISLFFSHSYISIFHNTYFFQAFALLFSITLFYSLIVNDIRSKSTYAIIIPCLTIMLTSYNPMLPLILAIYLFFMLNLLMQKYFTTSVQARQ